MPRPPTGLASGRRSEFIVMLTLMLLRHAKAEGHGRCDDFDRALTDRGKSEAVRLGDHLRATGPIPSLALVSSAKRTAQTYKGMAKRLRATIAVRYEDALFSATSTRLLAMIETIDPAAERLLVVGHNPCVAEAAADLATEGDPLDLARLRTHVPPCALAVIGFSASTWAAAMARRGRLEAYVMPDDLLRT